MDDLTVREVDLNLLPAMLDIQYSSLELLANQLDNFRNAEILEITL